MFTQKIVLEDNGIDRDVHITSEQATQQFKLNELDIDFIQEDIWENGAVNGELEVIVDEGLIKVNWQLMDWGQE